MTEVSPSSKKVDDFLSSISQLSQERLKEDEQRQRDLQRNIDDLRLRLNSSSPLKSSSFRSLRTPGSTRGHDYVPLLKFNRNLRLQNEQFFTDLDALGEEKPPQMPQRPGSSERQSYSSRGDMIDIDPPPMPKRPIAEKEESPPPMPPRRDIKKLGPSIPSKPANISSKFDVELLNPVARKSKPEPPAKNRSTPSYSKGQPLSKVESKYRSFADLEYEIKNGAEVGNVTKDIVNDLFKVDVRSSKPVKPVKSEKLSANLNTKEKSESPNVIPKPTYLSALAATKKQTRVLEPSALLTKQKYIPEHNDPSDVSIAKPISPQREKKQNSWLDSAIKQKGLDEPTIRDKHEKVGTIHQGSDSIAKSGSAHKPDFKTPPKPPKPSYDRYSQKDNEILKLQMQKLSSTKKPVPQKPRKLASKYEEEDTEILRSQLQKLSTNKVSPPKPSKPSTKNYQEKDNAILLSQMKKLGKNSTSSPREREEQSSPEGLAALTKLKPVKPPRSKYVSNDSNPEPIKKLEEIKSSDNSIDTKSSDLHGTRMSDSADLEPMKPKGTASFQDHLSSIIRASTVPNIHASKPASNIQRAKTVPFPQETESLAGSKLTHPNKSRAKGPKRRLPKTATRASSKSNHAARVVPTHNEVDEKSTPIIDVKKKKAPPPINKEAKKKALDNLKPSRNFSGELFI